MIEIWRRHFARGKFSLKYKDPSKFAKSQWQNTEEPSIIYLLYRWAFALTFLVTWLLSIILPREYDNRVKWMIYLTNWGYTICTLQGLLGAVIVTAWFTEKRRQGLNGEDFKKHIALKPYKIYWAVFTIAADIAFMITIIYWSLIYDSSLHYVDGINAMTHAVNSCLMFLDVLIVAFPIRLVHCYWAVLFGVCYLIFSIIYFFAGGTDREGNRYIYAILNWEEPLSTTLYCLATLLLLLVLHCFVFGVYHLRKFLYSKTRRKQPSLTRDTAMKEVYVNQTAVSETP